MASTLDVTETTTLSDVMVFTKTSAAITHTAASGGLNISALMDTSMWRVCASLQTV